MQNESIPACACGCGQPVSRSKKAPYGWNRFVHGHNNQQGTLEERFWAHVVKHEIGCWEWSGYRTRGGYGALWVGGRAEQRMLYAHRLSYELHYGPLPEGYYACHRCDNPSCPRPDHLFAGTAEENVQDAIWKGRFWMTKKGITVIPKGDAAPSAR